MGRLPLGFRYKRKGLLEYNFMANDKRFFVYGHSTTECIEKAEKIRSEIASGIYSKNKDVRMRDYFEEFIASKQGSVKETTILNNRSVYPRIDKVFGKEKIKDIESRQVKQFREMLAKEAADENAKLKTDGANKTLSLLKCIFESAVNDGIIARNPCAGIKLLKRMEERARDTVHRALTDDELKRFFEAAGGSYYRNAYLFMLHSGMRAGEVCALTWDDIDYESSNIIVSKTTTKAECGYVIGDSAKTEAGIRRIPMTDELKAILKNQRELVFALFGSRTDRLVFPSANGALCTPRNLSTMIRRPAKKAGVDHFGSHAFRHTFASRAVDSGVPPETLKEILGHKRISVTLDLYYHNSDQKKRDGMNMIKIGVAI